MVFRLVSSFFIPLIISCSISISNDAFVDVFSDENFKILGYNTVVYGTNSDYNFNAIQLEFPYPTIRDNQNSINTFAESFSSVIHDYFITYFNIDLF